MFHVKSFLTYIIFLKKFKEKYGNTSTKGKKTADIIDFAREAFGKDFQPCLDRIKELDQNDHLYKVSCSSVFAPICFENQVAKGSCPKDVLVPPLMPNDVAVLLLKGKVKRKTIIFSQKKKKKKTNCCDFPSLAKVLLVGLEVMNKVMTSGAVRVKFF